MCELAVAHTALSRALRTLTEGKTRKLRHTALFCLRTAEAPAHSKHGIRNTRCAPMYAQAAA